MNSIMVSAGCALTAALAIASCASSDLMTSAPDKREGAAISVPYALPKGLLKILVARDDDDVLTVDVLDVVYEPDPDHQYFLTYDHSAFSDDEISVETTDTGLLKKISAKSTDQRGEVVKKLIEFATEVGKAFIGARGKSLDPYPTFSYETLFDPTLKRDRDRLTEDLAYYGVDILDLDAQPVGKAAFAEGGAPDCSRGACFRPAMLHEFTIRFQNTPTIGNPDPTPVKGTANILLPNSAQIYAVELDRYAFVTAKTEVHFTDGMLTKVTLDKPSEAVAFMQIPIDVAKSIVSIPSALFDFRIKSVGDDQRLNAAQSSLIDSQIRLMEKQEQILEAQTEAQGAPE